MPDKKLTDNEIIDGFNHCLYNKNNSCEGCCFKDVVCDASLNGKITTLRMVAEVLNRLQAENKRLSTLAKLGNTRANDYRVMRDRALKAEAEVERLKKSNRNWRRKAQRLKEKNTVVLLKPENAKFENLEHFETRQISKEMLPAIVRRAKAEAYKECIEKVKEKAYTYSDITGYRSTVVDVCEIDGVYEELVGDNNAEAEKP